MRIALFHSRLDHFVGLSGEVEQRLDFGSVFCLYRLGELVLEFRNAVNQQNQVIQAGHGSPLRLLDEGSR